MKSLTIAAILCLALPSALFAGEGKEAKGPDAAKLWSQTCARCHNLRPARSFSDAQWDVIVHHMRVRVNLTGTEARRIAEFLKEAN